MNIKFLIAQLFGLLAIVFLYLSFKVNRKKYVLRCQAVSNFGYAMEYLLLGGITGSILSFLCIIRNLIYQKFPNGKVPLIWLVICIFLMVMMTIATYEDIFSILAAVAIIINSFGLWQKNMTTHRIIGLASGIMYIFCDIHLMGISFFATALDIIFVLSAIYRFDIKKRLK